MKSNIKIVDTLVCRYCRVGIVASHKCTTNDKEICSQYQNCLKVASQKDIDYLSVEFILRVLEINSNIPDRSCPNIIAKEIIKKLKNENSIP